MPLGSRDSQHTFATVPDVHIGRSQFDRSFAVKDAFDFDYLVPVFVDEVIPGDTMNTRLNAFARLATQTVPIMDNLYIDYFFFFVPNRLVHDNWEKLNGAKANPTDSTDFIMPSITAPATTGFTVGSIFDKMGLPTGVPNLKINNCLPLRCYNLIYNEWFRDQNLQNSITVRTDDGPDVVTDYVLRKRGKRHDYFTSCLPWPQKGPAVSMPLGGTAPVLGLGTPNAPLFSTTNITVREANLQSKTYATAQMANGASGGNSLAIEQNATTGYPNIRADLTAATAATINQLREAFLLQGLFEQDARAGTRYTEILRAHFGVVSPDFRLQRPEYLGGGSSRIMSHPVPQTAPGSSAMASLASFGTSSVSGGDGIGFSKSFVEHGYVIGLACARADITYQQGLNRMWSRKTRYDFFWPKLQQLGEQAVLNKELYAQGTAADEIVFGYQERYAEYRYKPSEIHGKFRSQDATPIDQWHMAEEFGSLPTLNSTFIQQNTPIARAIAVTSEPHLLIDLWYQHKCARPMLAYSVPATLGRF